MSLRERGILRRRGEQRADAKITQKRPTQQAQSNFLLDQNAGDNRQAERGNTSVNRICRRRAEAAASQITVTSVTLDPAVFFEDDTGIITIGITNNGPESVAIRRATMCDEDILVISSSYDTTTTVGAGNKMQFSFTVKADVPPRIYYPIFSLDFRDAGYLRYPVQLRVDNNPLEVSILNKPDTFGPGRKEQIDIVIGNPRDNPVSGTIVHFLGKDLDPIPSGLFVGVLNPDQAQKVSFNVCESSAELRRK